MGCTLAFLSFGLQQRVQPYRDMEANVCKACVDAQIFLTFLLSFILRVLPRLDSVEVGDAALYGYVLLTSLVLVVMTAVGLLGRKLCRHRHFRKRLIATIDPQFGDAPTTDINPFYPMEGVPHV